VQPRLLALSAGFFLQFARFSTVAMVVVVMVMVRHVYTFFR
jgi:hypothetical protein